jgi:hemoglobin
VRGVGKRFCADTLAVHQKLDNPSRHMALNSLFKDLFIMYLIKIAVARGRVVGHPSIQEFPMPVADLCTEDEVSQLVHSFYKSVREDETLGPIFERHVKDWDRHLATMVDFWSSALRGTARFRGSPMPKHVAIPGLNAGLFQHWIRLFRQNSEALPNAALRERANDLAARIAESLFYGYQMSHSMDLAGAKA